MNIENSDILSRQAAGSATALAPPIEKEGRREHFKTDHLLHDLKGGTISGGTVTMSATEIASFLLTVSVSRLRPQLPSRGSGGGSVVAFGVDQTAGNFIFNLTRGCDNLLIGRFYRPAAVALYSQELKKSQ